MPPDVLLAAGADLFIFVFFNRHDFMDDAPVLLRKPAEHLTEYGTY
jgi:hypothetical protein